MVSMNTEDMKVYAAQVDQALAFLKSRFPVAPEAAVILGSGLGCIAEAVTDAVAIPYEEIPGWKSSTAPGQAGRLVCGWLAGVPVAVMQGRLQGYEGYSAQETTFPVRVFGRWGIRRLFVTNATGGINYEFTNGDVVLITDHLNLTGQNPLTGPNNDDWGPRFPDMSEAYSRRMIALAEKAAGALGFVTRRGVYAGLAGPSYETPAEIRMLRCMGADLVGMSTVHEVIAANHMGMEVCGISCVSNPAAGMQAVRLSAEDVLAEMARSAQKIGSLIVKMLEMMKKGAA